MLCMQDRKLPGGMFGGSMGRGVDIAPSGGGISPRVGGGIFCETLTA
jgi:hypothetical protein